MASLFSRIEPALRRLAQRFDELELAIADPAVAVDAARLGEFLRERGRLSPLAMAFRDHERASLELAEVRAEEAGSTELEFLAYCRELRIELEGRLGRCEEDLLSAYLRDEEDGAECAILEIRAGVGGEEAALWAAELLRMYENWCKSRGLSVEIIEVHRAAAGGLKEAVVEIQGEGAYEALRFESGGHRVQRVPQTETQGRVHTSAATVAVLPEVKEHEVSIPDSDLRIETYRSGGPGGQHANKTSSAIRVTHLPSGLVVTCQDERSQHRNKARAFRVLQARLQDAAKARLAAERADARAGQVGTGDRSDRIRTYNFPQSRVTDHRIELTLHSLAAVLEGDLHALHEALVTADRERRIETLSARL